MWERRGHTASGAHHTDTPKSFPSSNFHSPLSLFPIIFPPLSLSLSLSVPAFTCLRHYHSPSPLYRTFKYLSLTACLPPPYHLHPPFPYHCITLLLPVPSSLTLSLFRLPLTFCRAEAEDAVRLIIGDGSRLRRSPLLHRWSRRSVQVLHVERHLRGYLPSRSPPAGQSRPRESRSPGPHPSIESVRQRESTAPVFRVGPEIQCIGSRIIGAFT